MDKTKKYNCSPNGIWKTFIRYNIPRRTPKLVLQRCNNIFGKKIYCKECFQIVKDTLLHGNNLEKVCQIQDLPIMAGKIHGIWPGEEFNIIEDVGEEISKRMNCRHIIRISILSDCDGEGVLYIDNKAVNCIKIEKDG
jgi:hypothetical protein